jgi:[lysine-biosynthesis-protein LysW]--L-2-aminoadipate ligase
VTAASSSAASSTFDLAVLASRVRFEEKRIFEALDRREVRYVHLDPRRIVGRLGGRPPRAGISGVPAVAAALNREISLTRAYYAALLFEAQGVTTINCSEVIGVCGDKLRTSFELERAGLPTPRTALALTPEAAADAVTDLGFPAVVKPLTGSWGRLAALVRDRAEADVVFEHRSALPSPQQHVLYLQELIDKPNRDIRVLVIGDAVVGACYRYAEGWRTNASRGAQSVVCPLTPALTELALRAAEAVGGGILSVDLVEGPDGLHVLEVNHMTEFRGLQSALGEEVDVADAIVGFALEGAA